MTPRGSRVWSEKGAVIIFVALVLLALIAFAAFIVDYGVMWVSRRQAQNAADAAAHAAAVALAFDTPPGVTTNGALAKQYGRTYAAQNYIWGVAPAEADVDVVTPFDGFTCPNNVTGTGCVRADVYRGTPGRTGSGTRGPLLPTFFAKMAGIANQGIRATATAQAASGDFATCVNPWAIPDKWQDNYDTDGPEINVYPNGVWTTDDEFEGTDELPPTNVPPPDLYIPPYPGNQTTGFTEENVGKQLVLKSAAPGNKDLKAGWVGELCLPGHNCGSTEYEDDIKFCNPSPIHIAAEDKVCTTENYLEGCGDVKTGVSQGPTKQGVNYLVGLDPDAEWNGQSVVNSAFAMSPRIKPLILFDPDQYALDSCKGGTQCVVKIVNLAGFFVEGMCKDVADAGQLDPGLACEDPTKDVVGRLINYPVLEIGATVDEAAAFLKVIRLVR